MTQYIPVKSMFLPCQQMEWVPPVAHSPLVPVALQCDPGTPALNHPGLAVCDQL